MASNGHPLLTVKIRNQALRFVIVGLSNVVLSYGVYLGLLTVASPVTSFLIASAVAIMYTAILNIRVVFQAAMRPVILLLMLLYYTAYAVVNAALLEATIRVLNMPAYLAPGVVMAVTVPANFLLSRYFIFGPRSKRGCNDHCC